jgi:regulatory LuxR family protein
VRQLIAQGKTTKEIAQRLAVSVKTAESHWGRLRITATVQGPAVGRAILAHLGLAPGSDSPDPDPADHTAPRSPGVDVGGIFRHADGLTASLGLAIRTVPRRPREACEARPWLFHNRIATDGGAL